MEHCGDQSLSMWSVETETIHEQLQLLYHLCTSVEVHGAMKSYNEDRRLHVFMKVRKVSLRK